MTRYKTQTEVSRAGGLARAKRLTPARRSEIARAAALTRWRKPSAWTDRGTMGSPLNPWNPLRLVG